MTVSMSHRQVGDLVAAGDAAIDVEKTGAGLDLVLARVLMNSASRAWIASATALRVPLIDSPIDGMSTTSTTNVRDGRR